MGRHGKGKAAEIFLGVVTHPAVLSPAAATFLVMVFSYFTPLICRPALPVSLKIFHWDCQPEGIQGKAFSIFLALFLLIFGPGSKEAFRLVPGPSEAKKAPNKLPKLKQSERHSRFLCF